MEGAPLPFRLPVTEEDSTASRLCVLSGRFCQGTDLVLLAGAFLVVVMLPFLGHHSGGFGEFLKARVSLRNVVIAVFCVGTWRVILVSIGVYSSRHMRSFNEYLFRCIIGLNSCAAVVGLIEVVLGARAGVWRMIEVFWVVGLLSTAVLRLALVGFERVRGGGERSGGRFR
jgi:hypothetical protein